MSNYIYKKGGARGIGNSNQQSLDPNLNDALNYPEERYRAAMNHQHTYGAIHPNSNQDPCEPIETEIHTIRSHIETLRRAVENINSRIQIPLSDEDPLPLPMNQYRIIVKNNDKDMLFIVNNHTTISELKRMIYNQSNIAIETQTLFYNDEIMNDDEPCMLKYSQHIHAESQEIILNEVGFLSVKLPIFTLLDTTS